MRSMGSALEEIMAPTIEHYVHSLYDGIFKYRANEMGCAYESCSVHQMVSSAQDGCHHRRGQRQRWKTHVDWGKEI